MLHVVGNLFLLFFQMTGPFRILLYLAFIFADPSDRCIPCSNPDGFRIEARITMRPHSAVGCWYNSSYVVSSDHKLLAHTGGISASLLWMNRLAPELANDFTLAGMRCLFKFYNTEGA